MQVAGGPRPARPAPPRKAAADASAIRRKRPTSAKPRQFTAFAHASTLSAAIRTRCARMSERGDIGKRQLFATCGGGYGVSPYPPDRRAAPPERIDGVAFRYVPLVDVFC